MTVTAFFQAAGSGRWLIATRKREPHAGMWNFPGGFVGPNETPQQAAAREMEEEMGVAIDAGEFRIVGHATTLIKPSEL